MKRIISGILLFIILLTSVPIFAQSGTTAADDDFNAGLLIFALIAFSAMIGSFIIGAIVMTIVVLCLTGLVAVGIISASVITGLYQRSLMAAFRTFTIIVCALGGTMIGISGLWLINLVFSLHLSGSVISWSGLAGGLTGGILLGASLGWIIRFLTSYLKKKMLPQQP